MNKYVTMFNVPDPLPDSFFAKGFSEEINLCDDIPTILQTLVIPTKIATW